MEAHGAEIVHNDTNSDWREVFVALKYKNELHSRIVPSGGDVLRISGRSWRNRMTLQTWNGSWNGFT